MSGIRKPAENSNVWCSGSTDEQLVVLVEVNSGQLRHIDVKFLCVSITPLGGPVVPDVKISDASASPFGRCTSAAADSFGSACNRSSKRITAAPP